MHKDEGVEKKSRVKCTCLQFLRDALDNTLEHEARVLLAAMMNCHRDGIGVQILANIKVTHHDALIRSVVESAGFLTSGT